MRRRPVLSRLLELATKREDANLHVTHVDQELQPRAINGTNHNSVWGRKVEKSCQFLVACDQIHLRPYLQNLDTALLHFPFHELHLFPRLLRVRPGDGRLGLPAGSTRGPLLRFGCAASNRSLFLSAPA